MCPEGLLRVSIGGGGPDGLLGVSVGGVLTGFWGVGIGVSWSLCPGVSSVTSHNPGLEQDL